MSDSSLAALFDPAFDKLFESGVVPGIAYGVIEDGELAYTRGLGVSDRSLHDSVPTADTMFRIASMTKSFTAATLLSLRDASLLSLDDRLVDFVPELRGGGPFNELISVRHLLTMGAGFPTDDPWGDRQQALAAEDFSRLLSTPFVPAWRPGDRFEYSNLGYALIGRVIEAVAGVSYADAVTERVLKPLKLSNTHFDVDQLGTHNVAVGYVKRPDGWEIEPMAPYGAFAPMGGLVSTVNDLARWVALFIAADADTSAEQSAEDPLRFASLREMQTGHRWVEAVSKPKLGAPLDRPSVLHYGFGLFEEVTSHGRTIAHSGGYPGFGSHMRWHPCSGLGVVALGNRTYVSVARAAAEALEAALVARRASTTIDLGDRTRGRLDEARIVAERLVNDPRAAADESLIGEWFADNVEQDEPWSLRKTQLASFRERHGLLAEEPSGEPPDVGPAHATWWLAGEKGGRVKISLLLSPHPRPLIQSVSWTSVPEPSALLRQLARQALLAYEPEGVLGKPIAGNGETTASFTGTGQAGKYEIEAKTADGQSRVRLVPLRLEPGD